MEFHIKVDPFYQHVTVDGLVPTTGSGPHTFNTLDAAFDRIRENVIDRLREDVRTKNDIVANVLVPGAPGGRL